MRTAFQPLYLKLPDGEADLWARYEYRTSFGQLEVTDVGLFKAVFGGRDATSFFYQGLRRYAVEIDCPDWLRDLLLSSPDLQHLKEHLSED